MWCAARISSRQHRFTCCCSGCSGCPTPHYHHHELILDEKGEKLSKSRDSTSLRQLRAGGRDGQAKSAQRLGFA